MPAPLHSGLSDNASKFPDNPCLPFEQDESAFYQALKADNQRAWNCLYLRVTNSFVPYACQRSQISIDDAHDILQDGLAEFSIKLRDGRYLYVGKPVAAYVFVVCRNRWVSFLKKNKLEKLENFPESTLADTDADAVETLLISGTNQDASGETVGVDNGLWSAHDVDWEAFSQAFQELSDDCRTMLHCFYVDGKSLKACGEEIGLQENSAKVKRYRCAQRLKSLYLTYRKED